MAQSSYNLVQKSELYALLMVLLDFPERHNTITDSQYAERILLHIEMAELILDDSKLNVLFIQLHQVIKNRNYPMYIAYIKFPNISTRPSNTRY